VSGAARCSFVPRGGELRQDQQFHKHHIAPLLFIPKIFATLLDTLPSGYFIYQRNPCEIKQGLKKL